MSFSWVLNRHSSLSTVCIFYLWLKTAPDKNCWHTVTSVLCPKPAVQGRFIQEQQHFNEFNCNSSSTTRWFYCVGAKMDRYHRGASKSGVWSLEELVKSFLPPSTRLAQSFSHTGILWRRWMDGQEMWPGRQRRPAHPPFHARARFLILPPPPDHVMLTDVLPDTTGKSEAARVIDRHLQKKPERAG